jgi:hypothetical protein
MGKRALRCGPQSDGCRVPDRIRPLPASEPTDRESCARKFQKRCRAAQRARAGVVPGAACPRRGYLGEAKEAAPEQSPDYYPPQREAACAATIPVFTFILIHSGSSCRTPLHEMYKPRSEAETSRGLKPTLQALSSPSVSGRALTEGGTAGYSTPKASRTLPRTPPPRSA